MHRQWCLRPSPQPSPRSHGEREFVECDASAMVLAPLTPTLSPFARGESFRHVARVERSGLFFAVAPVRPGGKTFFWTFLPVNSFKVLIYLINKQFD